MMFFRWELSDVHLKPSPTLSALNGHLVKEKLRDGHLIISVNSGDRHMQALGDSVTKPLSTVVIDPELQMGNQRPEQAKRIRLDYCLQMNLVLTTEARKGSIGIVD